MNFSGLTLADLVGTSGTLMVAIAYSLTQLRRLRATDWAFPATNLVGSILISFSLYHHFNLASVLMELFWMVISIFGLYRSIVERRLDHHRDSM